MFKTSLSSTRSGFPLKAFMESTDGGRLPTC